MITDLRHHLPRILILLVAVGVLRFVGLLPPVYVGLIIDSLTENQTQGGLWLVGMIGVIAAVRALAAPFVTRWVTGFVQDLVKERSILWVRTLLDKDFRFFRDASLGGLLRSTDRGLAASEVYITYVIVQVIPNTIELVIVGVYLAVIAGVGIVAMLLVMAGLLALVTIGAIRWRRPYIDAVNDAEDAISGNLAEVIEAGNHLKIMRAKANAGRFLGRSFEDYRARAVNLSFVSEIVASAQTMLVAAGTVVTLLYGVVVVSNGQTGITTGDFVVIFSFTGIFMMNIQRLAEAYRQTDQFRADKAAFDEVLRLPAFRQTGVAAPGCGAVRIAPFRREVAPGFLLTSQAEIHVAEGSSLAIFGATGGGKSSLLRTIGGLETPECTVFIGGVDITHLAEDDLFRTVYVDQQASMFPGGDPAWSLLFRFGEALDAPVFNLARELAVDHLIEDGKRINAKSLSGGEKRRLALIRALVSRTPVLLLDEPTESLDLQTANRVWDIIFRESQHRTLICITHDHAALPRFNAVLAVDKGQIAPTKPVFKQISQVQSS